MPVEKESGRQTWAQKREGSLLNAISSEEESCPILSIYGNHFSIIRDHARYVLQDPSDVSKKITSLDVVLIDVLSLSSKAFYKPGYDEKSEAMGPTCFSTDGITPDASIETPQCHCCAECPARNDINSRGYIEPQNPTRLVCYDFARVLVITCNDPYEALILWVPASHIKSLSDYVHDLEENSTPYQSLITRVSFTLDQPKPQLTFKALKFLLAPEYKNLRNRIKVEKEKWALSEDKSSPQQVNTLRKKAAILSERANGQLKKLGIEVQESNPSPKGLTYKEILAQQTLQKILKIEEPQPIKTISGQANEQLKKLDSGEQDTTPSPKGHTYEQILAQQEIQQVLEYEEPQPIKTISGQENEQLKKLDSEEQQTTPSLKHHTDEQILAQQTIQDVLEYEEPHHITTLSFSDLHKKMVLVTLKQQSYRTFTKVRFGRVKPNEMDLFEIQQALGGKRELLDLHNLQLSAKLEFIDLSLPWGEDDNTRAVPIGLYSEISRQLSDYRIRLAKAAKPIAEALDPTVCAVFKQMCQLDWYFHPTPDTFDALNTDDIKCLNDTYHDFQVIAMEAVWKRLKDKFDLVDRVVIEGFIENKSVNLKQATLVNLMEASDYASKLNFLKDLDLDSAVEAIHIVYGDIERFNDLRHFEELKQRVIIGTAEIRELLSSGMKKYQ